MIKKNLHKVNHFVTFAQFKKALATSIIGALLGAGLVGVVDYAYQYFTPASWWVSYDSIQSEGEITDGKLRLNTTSNYPRGGDVIWSDQLWCRLDGREVLYSSFTDSVNNIDKPYPKSSYWLYQGFIPPTGTECQLRANVTVRTPFGVKKQINTASNTFTIK